ncbi:hypothetical protein [Enhygromyxa salina]|uniref:hypothetical protein n=1 Tax=Enhygromyxa salina TaxID=215803 RepID=UPI001293DC1B|nr:hypothetical protein [Enhygromyxa salina]
MALHRCEWAGGVDVAIFFGVANARLELGFAVVVDRAREADLMSFWLEAQNDSCDEADS